MSQNNDRTQARPGSRGGRFTHDVIIVGASVAGCRTALTLAEHGVRVLLLDRSEFPRWKPCAGGLTLKTRRYLPAPLFDLVECTITGAHLTFEGEYITHIRSETPLGWMIHRESFDAAHLQLARSQPTVDVALGTAVLEIIEHASGVRVVTSGGEMEARVLVGADGAKSIVSRALPGHDQRLMGFAYEGEARAAGTDNRNTPPARKGDAGELVAGPSLAGETYFDFSTFPRGYGWVFPKRDHVSFGGFVYGRRLPEIREVFADFHSRTEALAGTETYRTRGHPVCLGGNARRLNSRRILLAGEAGGLVDPLTGEGIYYALRSGHLAGEYVARFLAKGEPLDAYGNAVRNEIQSELRAARTVAEFVFNHPRLSFHLLLRNALFCRWFAEIGSGSRSYSGLFGEALMRAPLLPFHAGFSRRQEVQVAAPAGPS
jgi:geranylgeranyl reductase family protein